MEMKCPNCGYSNKEDSLCCNLCGKVFRKENSSYEEKQNIYYKYKDYSYTDDLFNGKTIDINTLKRLLNFFVITTKDVLINPSRFFDKVYMEGINRHLLWSVTYVLCISILISIIILAGLKIGLYEHFLPSQKYLHPTYITPTIDIGRVILIPLIIIINMLIDTLIFHLCIRIIARDEHNKFWNTLIVINYSSATGIFSLIPHVIGVYTEIIWKLVVRIIGLKHVHELSTIKSILLLPTFVAISIILGICINMIFKFFGSSAI